MSAGTSVIHNRFWAMPHLGIYNILMPPVIFNICINKFTVIHMREA